MDYPYYQSALDSLCGVYAVVNADRIVNNSTEEESQRLFNEIIIYLHKKKKLKDTVIGGVYARDVAELLSIFGNGRILWETRQSPASLNQWWKDAKKHMFLNNNSILLSIGGKENHYTTIEKITEKTLYLADSAGINTIRKNKCKLYGYDKEDKKEFYIIYPKQCFYIFPYST